MRAAAALVWVLCAAAPLAAQDAAPAAVPVDPTKLGVSLARIQKGLRLASAAEQSSATPLHLEFQVQVFGQAPAIDVLKGVDLLNGSVPGTAPSHRDVIDFLTPQIFRTPGLPVSALAGWAIGQLSKRSRRSECEDEIAQYRAMVMRGMNVAAPRCTQ